MVNDKVREEFESWIKKETGFDVDRTEFPMTNRENQQYLNHSTNLAWFAWQASRAALVVNTLELRSADYYATGTVYLGDVEDALDKAGIKYE